MLCTLAMSFINKNRWTKDLEIEPSIPSLVFLLVPVLSTLGHEYPSFKTTAFHYLLLFQDPTPMSSIPPNILQCSQLNPTVLLSEPHALFCSSLWHLPPFSSNHAVFINFHPCHLLDSREASFFPSKDLSSQTTSQY